MGHAAALMIAANPSLTPAQIKARLIAGSDESTAMNTRSVSHGTVNVANALAGREGWNLGAAANPAAGSAAYNALKKSKIGLSSIEGTPDAGGPTNFAFVNPFSTTPTIKREANDLLA